MSDGRRFVSLAASALAGGALGALNADAAIWLVCLGAAALGLIIALIINAD